MDLDESWQPHKMQAAASTLIDGALQLVGPSLPEEGHAEWLEAQRGAESKQQLKDKLRSRCSYSLYPKPARPSCKSRSSHNNSTPASHVIFDDQPQYLIAEYWPHCRSVSH